MKLRRYLAFVGAVFAFATSLPAQQSSGVLSGGQPTFREHRIGESAEQFFSIAKMTEKNGTLATDYCRSYLNDPKVRKAVEKERRKGLNDPSLSPATLDVEGCNSVLAALAGRDVEVETRFAAEFGVGKARFMGGHLVSVSFVVKASFNDVSGDMTEKLNAKPELSVATVQNAVGAILKEHRALWTLPNVVVRIADVHSLDGSKIGTSVFAWDPAMLKRRANSLD